jgi:hypothetical protein
MIAANRRFHHQSIPKPTRKKKPSRISTNPRYNKTLEQSITGQVENSKPAANTHQNTEEWPPKYEMVPGTPPLPESEIPRAKRMGVCDRRLERVGNSRGGTEVIGVAGFLRIRVSRSPVVSLRGLSPLPPLSLSSAAPNFAAVA